MKKVLAAIAVGAIVVIGSGQHAIGTPGSAAIEAALDLVVGEALACGGKGNGNGNGNGWGKGGRRGR